MIITYLIILVSDMYIVYQKEYLSLTSLDENELWFARQVRTLVCGEHEENIIINTIHRVRREHRSIVLAVGKDKYSNCSQGFRGFG